MSESILDRQRALLREGSLFACYCSPQVLAALEELRELGEVETDQHVIGLRYSLRNRTPIASLPAAAPVVVPDPPKLPDPVPAASIFSLFD